MAWPNNTHPEHEKVVGTEKEEEESAELGVITDKTEIIKRKSECVGRGITAAAISD